MRPWPPRPPPATPPSGPGRPSLLRGASAGRSSIAWPAPPQLPAGSAELHRRSPGLPALLGDEGSRQAFLLAPHPPRPLRSLESRTWPAPVRRVAQCPAPPERGDGGAGVQARSATRRRGRCSASAERQAGRGLRLRWVRGGPARASERLPTDVPSGSTVTSPRVRLSVRSLTALQDDCSTPRHGWDSQQGTVRPGAPRPGGPARPAPRSEVDLATQKSLSRATPQRAVAEAGPEPWSPGTMAHNAPRR